MAEPTLLSCHDLVVGYGGRPLLPPVGLTIERGQFWAVVGRNGAGKTTFFKTVLGLQPPVSGKVARPPGVEVAYLAQRMAFDDLYPVLARDVVSHGTVRGWSLKRRSDAAGAVDRAMAAVGVSDLAGRTFRSLSGGQKQRVLFARMLATGAPLVLLDEPTAGMDAVAEREVMELLERLREDFGLTIVVVTHYLPVARDHAGHMLFLDREGRHAVVGETDEVFAHPAFVDRYGTVLETTE